MRLKTNERRRGAVAPLVAVALVAIVGVTGLVVDGGLMRDQRRRVQASADAAALAAAYDIFHNYATLAGADTNGTAKKSALATASANGYTNDGTTSVVTVNIPPTSGSFSGKSGYAEVIIQYNQRRGLSGVFGGGSTAPVKARAVARGEWKSFPNGIIVLNPTAPSSLFANGGTVVDVKNASVLVNSTAPDAGNVTGGGIVTAPELAFGGSPGYVTTGGSTLSGTILTNQPPVSDPLAYLPEPDPSTLTVRSTNKTTMSGNQTYVLFPGVYKGGISITGNANVYLMPGIYYMQGGGFSFSGQGTLTGYGVMIYNAPTSNSDVIDLSGQGAVNLTPMTSGTYAGISLFQQRSSTNTVSLSGGGNMTITGTFYAAGGTLSVTGNGASNVIGSQYISDQLKLGGNGAVAIDWKVAETAKMRYVGLVE